MKQWAVNHKRTFERNAVDTLKLARKFLPQEQKKDLASLCSYFGIERVHAHRALDDVMETQQILNNCKKCMRQEHRRRFDHIRCNISEKAVPGNAAADEISEAVCGISRTQCRKFMRTRREVKSQGLPISLLHNMEK